MEINVQFDVAGGTAKLDGTLTKEEVEYAVKYGLYHMIVNGVLPVTEVEKAEAVFHPGNDTVN